MVFVLAPSRYQRSIALPIMKGHSYESTRASHQFILFLSIWIKVSIQCYITLKKLLNHRKSCNLKCFSTVRSSEVMVGRVPFELDVTTPCSIITWSILSPGNSTDGDQLGWNRSPDFETPCDKPSYKSWKELSNPEILMLPWKKSFPVYFVLPVHRTVLMFCYWYRLTVILTLY